MKTTNRIEWLDFLRGLAAMAIVAYHFHVFLGLSHTGYAVVAVDMFFALSGIVLALKYTDSILGGMGPLEFAGARLRRLYPMVLIAGLFIVALNLARIPSGTHMLATDTDAWTVLLVTPLPRIPAGAFPPDPPMWSFWAELAANAVWFAVLKAGRRWMVPLGVASMATIVVVALRMNTLNVGWEVGLMFRLASLARALAWFCVGYAIAMRAISLKASVAVFLTLLAAFVAAVRVGHGHEGFNELVAASVSVALLNVAYRLPAPPRYLGTASRWLGMISFPLYLMHSPAGRLLPYFDFMPPWGALLLVVGGATVGATLLNEAAVKWVNKAYRSRVRTAVT
jgi:peptidoglycan/LPS O-acetylase OafA/YrhL